MQRSLKFIGVFAGVGIGAMLWFWLAFGNYRVVCGEIVQSLFLAGSAWFAGLAVLWGGAALVLMAGRGPLLLRGAILSFALGSLFHTFHLGVFNWWIGVNLAVSALLAIAITQSPMIYYLYHLLPSSQPYRRAGVGWLAILGAGLLGVAGTQLLFLTIPCQVTSEYVDLGTRILQCSAIWYLIWGVLPSLVTAWIMAGETQSELS